MSAKTIRPPKGKAQTLTMLLEFFETLRLQLEHLISVNWDEKNYDKKLLKKTADRARQLAGALVDALKECKMPEYLTLDLLNRDEDCLFTGEGAENEGLVYEWVFHTLAPVVRDPRVRKLIEKFQETAFKGREVLLMNVQKARHLGSGITVLTMVVNDPALISHVIDSHDDSENPGWFWVDMKGL